MSVFDLLAKSSFPDDGLRSMGDDARDKQEWGRCVGLYEQYLETAPENAAIWVQLGHAYKETGGLDLAERCYLRALSIEPLNPDTHLQLGHVEKLRGDKSQAGAHYRKALQIAPDFGPALSEYNGGGGDDAPPLATPTAPASAQLERDFLNWREGIEARLAVFETSIGTLNEKAIDVEKLGLTSHLSGKEVVGRLDSLAAVTNTLQTKVLELQKNDALIGKVSDKEVEGRFKEVVGRLDALTFLMGTLKSKVAEVEKLAAQRKKK